eukprot:9484897-Pyramimonas_sp.AAC.2
MWDVVTRCAVSACRWRCDVIIASRLSTPFALAFSKRRPMTSRFTCRMVAFCRMNSGHFRSLALSLSYRGESPTPRLPLAPLQSSKGRIYPGVQPIEAAKGEYAPVFNQSKQQREYIPQRLGKTLNSLGYFFGGSREVREVRQLRRVVAVVLASEVRDALGTTKPHMFKWTIRGFKWTIEVQ